MPRPCLNVLRQSKELAICSTDDSHLNEAKPELVSGNIFSVVSRMILDVGPPCTVVWTTSYSDKSLEPCLLLTPAVYSTLS